MENDFTYDELRSLIEKLASIPVEQRQIYVEYLSNKAGATDKINFAARLYEIFSMIDSAKMRQQKGLESKGYFG